MSEEREYIKEVVQRLALEYEITEKTIHKYINILKELGISYYDDNFSECLEMVVSERSSIYHNEGVDTAYSLEETIKRAYQEIYGENLKVSDSMKETFEIEEFEKAFNRSL